jgi:hypothetical protein
MGLSRQEMADAIQAELVRDQEELAEVEKRMLELHERVKANRGWLKAYGYLDQTPAEPAVVRSESPGFLQVETRIQPDAVPEEPAVLSEPDDTDVPEERELLAKAAETVLEDFDNPVGVTQASDASAATDAQPEIRPAAISEGPRLVKTEDRKNLKNEDRKRMYDALISRGARLNS